MKVAFTGHRKIESPKEIGDKLSLINFSKVDEFFVGGSTGFDFIVLKFLIDKGWSEKIRLCIPFKGFEKYIEKNDQNLKEMMKVHYSGNIKIYDFNKAGTSFSDKTKARNQYMIDQSDLLYCYWDGNYKSGTAQTVRMANKKKIAIFNLKKEGV